ncbi:MAG: hypothetical protein U5L04_07000 [Trueperaceae bacterium]|nr:hypothetical protein [Trueperaceae bacterium]
MDDDQLEAWILEQVKGVENDQLVEDNRVELKATWLTDHHKAARQIAGLINASMGKYVLWIVGLDEDEGVVGAEREEVSNWWPQVAKRFDGVSARTTSSLLFPMRKGILSACFLEQRESLLLSQPKRVLDLIVKFPGAKETELFLLNNRI